MGRMNETQIKNLETEKARREAETGMLLSDDQEDEDFKGNKSDPRFAQMLARNKEFAQDPTHKEFRKITEGPGGMVRAQQKKRQRKY
mmetsp:Transcript_15936/g.24636  ORF Transcript_15936/g.24636 Transcript_15936/m.24636 type:complete len:87 (+) Transcript_15936:1597-1857(+)